ncbi:O-methyltransferase [Uliginosibacterium sp. H1]|uniref:O-methyltransferase n=1 Tax=Uliginosibacterium sp. H1 TaxID=3114757 RepID=UPI002E17A490|nr:O-methyltransferase [Uliginosibacterium sp. H1]
MSQELWSAVDEYLVASTALPDPALDAVLADTAAAGIRAINVSPNQGKLLNLLARIQGARRVLEIGTLGGYSAIWLARSLPADGRLVTLELDPQHAEVARRNIERAGLLDKVDIRIGPALSTLQALHDEGVAPFDFVFIDADKENNRGYLEGSLKLTRPGSVIVVDNVVRGGAVIDAHSSDTSVQGVRTLFDGLAGDPRVEATAIQTVGSKGYDGLAVLRVTG